MIYVLLDILIYNFTTYHSYFFLINITNKSYLYNLIVALFIDVFITKTFGLNLILVSLLYLLSRVFIKINLNNILIYSLVNIINILVDF